MLFEKPKSRYRLENNIKMEPERLVTEDVDRVELIQRNGHSCRLM
jgi:hypothetical protein